MTVMETKPEVSAHGEPVEGKCNAISKDGDLCRNPAGFKTEHVGIGRCHMHFGNSPDHIKHARREQARRDCVRLGIPVDVDPGEALILRLHEVEGDLAFYRAQVEALGLDVTEVEKGPNGAYKHAAHPLVALYHQAEERSVVIATAALKAGVEERRLRMEETETQVLFAAQARACVAAGLTPEQVATFRSTFAAALRSGDAIEAESVAK